MNIFRWAEHLNLRALEREHGLPRGLMTALMRQESNGWNDRGSPAGAQGLFQIMPRIARHYGIDPCDPHAAARVAAAELGAHYRRYDGDLDKTLIAYNYGHRRLVELRREHGRHRWKEHLPEETRHYIDNIVEDMAADAQIRTIYHQFKDITIRDPRNADRLDDRLLDNAAIRNLVRARLREHGYSPGRTDAQLHAALEQFEQQIENRDMRTYGTRFANDGELDFASLGLLITRTPGLTELLDNPRRR